MTRNQLRIYYLISETSITHGIIYREAIEGELEKLIKENRKEFRIVPTTNKKGKVKFFLHLPNLTFAVYRLTPNAYSKVFRILNSPF